MPKSQDPLQGDSRHERFAAIGVSLLVVVLSAALLANSMLKPLSRDEHMYCTAGALAARGQMVYRDFAYPSQLPYHPVLLAACYKTLGATHYLLIGRVISVASDIGVLIVILAVYRRAFGRFGLEGWLFGGAGAVLHAFNPSVAWASGYAWNHDVVILCVVLAFWLFITIDFGQRPQLWRPALMGALLMFATCMRVTTVIVTALFFAALFLKAPGSLAKRTRALLPFTLAAFLVAAWPVWIFMHAPEAMRLNLFQVPALYARWLHDHGMAFGKVRLTLAALTAPGYLILLVLGGYLAVVTIGRRKDVSSEIRTNIILAALSVAAFVVIAFVPPTMWDQYWAMPVPFLVISLAFPLALLCKHAESFTGIGRFHIARLVILVCALLTVSQNTALLTRTPNVLTPERWVPRQVHKTAVEMARHLPEEGPVLTLGPLYALEGDRDIYPELASGAIVYRIADSMSPEQRAATHTAGPNSLKALIQQSPPAGAILGVETSSPDLESPLRRIIPGTWGHSEDDAGLAVYRP